MLRGSVVLFTGILSVIVLKRKLRGFHWLGMFFVLVGVGIVGMSPLLEHDVKPEPSASNPVLGNILIILAQMIVAVQMVIEEKFIGGYNIPALQAVGWEGIWGTLILSTFVFVMYYIPPLPGIGNPGSQHFEDALDAFTQISHNGLLALAILGNVLSIAFFNFFGISVTKAMSASHRMVLDSVRTIVIWAVSLAVGWQSFNFLQLVGFVILLAGTAVYNELVTVPGFPTKFEGEDSDDDTMAEYWQMDDSEGGNGGKRGGASAYSLENESQSLLSPRITQADELFTPRFSKNIARGR
jgi:drug/metabolite transporter (DMT)-like permease